MPRKNGPLLASGYKHCFSCRETLPVGSFYKAASKPDGFTSQCKECAKATAKDVRDRKKLMEATLRRAQERAGTGLRLIDLVDLDAALQECAA